jgi:adenylate kinase
MAVALLAGVPGVGLSSMAEQTRRDLDDDYLLINFGDAMLEQAATQGLAASRSELASLSRVETRRLQRRAGEYVADKAESNKVLLTTHLAVRTDSGFLPGLPDAVFHDVDPDLFVLVEASPDTILNRRATADRDYDDVSRHAIEFEQDLNRTAAFEYAVEADAPVQLVENEDDVDVAATALTDVLRTGL